MAKKTSETHQESTMTEKIFGDTHPVCVIRDARTGETLGRGEAPSGKPDLAQQRASEAAAKQGNK